MVALERKRDYRYKENWVEGRKEYEAQRQREREGRNLKGKEGGGKVSTLLFSLNDTQREHLKDR